MNARQMITMVARGIARQLLSGFATLYLLHFFSAKPRSIVELKSYTLYIIFRI